MPIHFKYHKEKDALYGSIEGEFSIKEIHRAIREITGSKEFSPDVRTLWDMRKLDFSTIDISLLMDAVSARNKSLQRADAKLAFIVDSDLGFGMMRMYEVLSDDLLYKVRVFKDYSEGENWLLIK